MATPLTAINVTRGDAQGTLGAILRDRRNPTRLYALTAGHVLAAYPDAAGGDLITFSDAGGDLSFFGSLVDWVPNFVPSMAATTTDAAIALIDAAAVRGIVANAAAWPTGIADVRNGDVLRLLTRDRGPIDGVATSRTSCPMSLAGKDISYPLSDAQAWFAPGGAVPGDSGAPVWNDSDQLVGIHVGTEFGEQQRPLLIPIYRILEYFKVDLVLRNEPLSPPPSVGAHVVIPQPTRPVPTAPSSPAALAHADILARTLWGEARGEGEAGMRAVAFVVLNRAARHNYWGANVTEICRKPYQFSCWNSDDPNLHRLLVVSLDDPQFRQALDIATAMLSDARGLVPAEDPTNRATHYHARGLPRPPWWTVGHTACARIGRHIFYNDIG